MLITDSFFDQNSSAAVRDTLQLLGNDIPVTDQSDLLGGLSALRMGWAQRILPSLAVGGSVGVYTGSVERNFVRSFDVDSLPMLGTIEDFSDSKAWNYSGPLISVNLSWDLFKFLFLCVLPCSFVFLLCSLLFLRVLWCS